MGSICVTGPISLHMPVVERACEVTRGADRAEMLRFACRFTEFGGWVFQDAADLVCAMHWTDRALDYALELGDQRVIAYTLMRKAMIATENGNPATASASPTPRLRPGRADAAAQGGHLAPAVVFQRGPGGSDRFRPRLRGSRYRGCRGRKAGRGGPGALLHAGVRGHGSGASWALSGTPGPRFRSWRRAGGMARSLAGPRLCVVRVAPGDGLCRRANWSRRARRPRRRGARPGAWLAPRGWPDRGGLP